MACVVKPITFIDLSASDPLSGDDESEVEDPLSVEGRNTVSRGKPSDGSGRGFKELCSDSTPNLISSPVLQINGTEPDHLIIKSDDVCDSNDSIEVIIPGKHPDGCNSNDSIEVIMPGKHPDVCDSNDSEEVIIPRKHPGDVRTKGKFSINEVSDSVWLHDFKTAIDNLELVNTVGTYNETQPFNLRYIPKRTPNFLKPKHCLNARSVRDVLGNYDIPFCDPDDLDKIKELITVYRLLGAEDSRVQIKSKSPTSKSSTKQQKFKTKMFKKKKYIPEPVETPKTDRKFPHLIRERERRKHIQEMFTQLAEALNLTEITHSKIRILNLAIEDILKLQKKVFALKDTKRSLKQQQQLLLSNLSRLDIR